MGDYMMNSNRDELVGLLKGISKKPERLASEILIAYLKSIQRGSDPYNAVFVVLLRNMLYKSRKPSYNELMKVAKNIVDNLKNKSEQRVKLMAIYHSLLKNRCSKRLVKEFYKDHY